MDVQQLVILHALDVLDVHLVWHLVAETVVAHVHLFVMGVHHVLDVQELV